MFNFSNPNSKTDRFLQNIIWSRMHSDQYNYLDIGENPTMKDHLNTDRYAVWNQLFPLVDLEHVPDEKQKNRR